MRNRCESVIISLIHRTMFFVIAASRMRLCSWILTLTVVDIDTDRGRMSLVRLITILLGQKSLISQCPRDVLAVG